MIVRVAPSRANILIIGESGTGKEWVAKSIHSQSSVSQNPFVAVNCGAIAESLIESELFGHVKGSFTGAVTEKIGLFQAAHRGTLFLDEVGELSLSMQVKLLRAIQERKFRKLGGVEDIEVDVRLISATNRNLEDAISQGKFREDLFYRLNVIQIKTPPLRDREGDVEFLVHYFLESFAKKKKQPMKEINQDALDLLCGYSWPGNVRELENVLERALALESGEEITPHALPEVLRQVQEGSRGEAQHFSADFSPDLNSAEFHLDRALARYEAFCVTEALRLSQGDHKGAARRLGISQKNLTSRMCKLRIKNKNSE